MRVCKLHKAERKWKKVLVQNTESSCRMDERCCRVNKWAYAMLLCFTFIYKITLERSVGSDICMI